MSKHTGQLARVIDRDGPRCWYCSAPFASDDIPGSVIHNPPSAFLGGPCGCGDTSVQERDERGNHICDGRCPHLQPTRSPAPGFHFPEREHVVPKSKGGSLDDDNVVASCSRCNAHKRTTMPDEWSVPIEWGHR